MIITKAFESGWSDEMQIFFAIFESSKKGKDADIFSIKLNLPFYI